jgi:hypothetical protein
MKRGYYSCGYIVARYSTPIEPVYDIKSLRSGSIIREEEWELRRGQSQQFCIAVLLGNGRPFATEPILEADTNSKVQVIVP